jgi:hypothetical protein
VDSVSQNRRDPDGPMDPSLRVLLFDSPDPRGAVIASVVNFACHATVLYHTNMKISADYPGYALATVRKIVGDAPSLFLNGPCGDVNPSWIEQDYFEAERVGSIVGAESARRLQELRPLGSGQRTWNIRWDELTDHPVPSGQLVEPRIGVASRLVEVPIRPLRRPAEYDSMVEDLNKQLLALDPADVDGRRRLMEQHTRFRTERTVAERLGPAAGHTARPEVQAIVLGEGCAILGLPGEFFVETGQAIQRAARMPNLLVACYANHYVGYAVPRHEFARGGYEAGVAMLDEGAEEAFREAAVDVLRDAAQAAGS